MSHTNRIAVGSQIAPHLKLATVLGEGGMARVFEAHHTRLNASVAVKVLTLTGDGAEQAGWRLVREARICARIEDPHIPRVYDVAELPDGRPYVVMEKVTGPTLEQYMLDGTPTVTSVISVARELLLALKAVHRAGIVHRDVKPGNVILQRVHGRVQGVRLMDFGIAHVRADAEDPSSMTSPGIVVGTPGYMAPEQVYADSVDARADLYSLGVVIYEMLTGSLPFTNPDSMARLRATVEDNVPDVRRLRKDCPADLAELVFRATRRVRGERFGSAEEMLEALDACERTQAVGRATPRAPRSPLRKAALMGVGACMVTMAWWMSTPVELAILRVRDEAVGRVSPEPATYPGGLQAGAVSADLSGRMPTRTEALSLRANGNGARPNAALVGVSATGEPGAGQAEVRSSRVQSGELGALSASAAGVQKIAGANAQRPSHDLKPPQAPIELRASEPPAVPAEESSNVAHAVRSFDRGVLVSEYLRKLEAMQEAASRSIRQPPGDDLPDRRAFGLPENPYDRPQP